MTDRYAPAKAAYRELRATIGPWAKANSYRRWAGTQAGWQKPMGEQRLLFKFEGDSFVNPDTGNSFHGLVQLEPLGSHGSTIRRQSNFIDPVFIQLEIFSGWSSRFDVSIQNKNPLM